MNKKENLHILNSDLTKVKSTVEKLNKKINSLNKRISFIESIDEGDLEDIYFDKLKPIDQSDRYSRATFFQMKIKAPDVYITLGYTKTFNNKKYKVTFDKINLVEVETSISIKNYGYFLSDINKVIKETSSASALVSKELNDKIMLSLKSNITKYYSDILKENKEYDYYYISEKSLFYDEYLRLKNLEIFK